MCGLDAISLIVLVVMCILTFAGVFDPLIYASANRAQSVPEEFRFAVFIGLMILVFLVIIFIYKSRRES